MFGLTVVRAGLSDTIQDLGRPGLRPFGVPVGGAFDLDAHGLANALVGNPPTAASLEMTLVGGEYRADRHLAIALAGAPMVATIERADGSRDLLHIPQSATLAPGDRLVMGGARRGARTYLAARGGWRFVWWGSWEPAPCVSMEARLNCDDSLQAEPGRVPVRRPSPRLTGPEPDGPIRVLDGPDAPAMPIDWGSLSFRLSPDCDRMGLRLEGPPLDIPADPDRVSAPVAPGAVQVAGGRVIILGPAGGTMGGYPHVAHVISADMGRLAQARPGEEIRFRRVGLDEARRLDRDDRRRRAERLATVRTAAGDDSCGRLIGGH